MFQRYMISMYYISNRIDRSHRVMLASQYRQIRLSVITHICATLLMVIAFKHILCQQLCIFMNNNYIMCLITDLYVNIFFSVEPPHFTYYRIY